MKETINIGIIGLGEIGNAHISALSKVREAKVAAIADIDPAQLEKFSHQKDIKSYTDYREMLLQKDIDAVIIATPDQLHTDPCVNAAKAGKHILVEKPIATTVEDGTTIVDVAAQMGVKLMVGFTLRFFPQYQYAKQAVSKGDLGKLVSIFARRSNLKSRQEKLKGRTGVLYFLGVHDFDMMRWIIGSEPESIYCDESTSVPGPYEGENETFTIIRFKNGVVACAHIGWFLPDKHPAGFDFKLDLTGSQGVLHLDMIRQGVEVFTEQIIQFPYMAEALIAEDQAFVDSLLYDRPVPVNGEDGLMATKMVVAALESLRCHQPVNL